MIISAQNEWIFEKENGEKIHPKAASRCLFNGKSLTAEGTAERINLQKDMSYIRFDCTNAYGDEILHAERIWVELRGHMMFAVTRIQAAIPIKPISRFAVNNGDGAADIRIFHDNRVVVRRDGFGIKILPCEMLGINEVMNDGKGSAGDFSLEHPINGEVSLHDFKATKFSTSYVGAFAIIQDVEPMIRTWHLYNIDERCCQINPKDNMGRLSITITSEDNIVVQDTHTAGTFTID